MKFEWDPEKARKNLTRHSLSFEIAIRVWEDPLHVIAPDRVEEGEQRWRAIGTVGTMTLLVVIHVYRGVGDEERVRIIGARRATPTERKRYERETS
jgi:uncharacterized protein